MGLADILRLRGLAGSQNYIPGTPSGTASSGASTSTAGVGGPGNPGASLGTRSSSVQGGGVQGGGVQSGVAPPSTGGVQRPVGHSGLLSQISQTPRDYGQSAVDQINQNSVTPNPANQKHPGVISRLFDILGRPEMAIASAIKDSSLDPNRDPVTGGRAAGTTGQGKGHFDAGGILKGLSQGIQGKDKTTVMDLYNDPASPTSNQPAHGTPGQQGYEPARNAGIMGNKVVHAGAGLLQGALFDPSTYLSLGTSKIKDIKGLTDAEKLLTAAKGTHLGVQAAGVASDVSKASTTAKALADAARTGHAVTSTEKDLGAVRNLSRLPTDAKALELKIAGRPILSSTKAYTAGRLVTDPLRYSAGGQLAGDIFKAGHNLPAGVHNMLRSATGVGRQDTRSFDEYMMRQPFWKDIKGTLGKGADQTVFKHVQENTPINEVEKVLQPAVQWMRDELHGLTKTSQIPATSWKAGAETATATQGDLFGQAGKGVRFANQTEYKGGPQLDRASQAMHGMVDKATHADAYANIMKEISQKYPDPTQFEAVKSAFDRAYTDFGKQGEVSARLQHGVNYVQQPWKKFVTAYRPGFQIKHAAGSLLDANMAGTAPERLLQARSIIKELKNPNSTKLFKMFVDGKPEKLSAKAIDALYKSGGNEAGFIGTEVAGRNSSKIGKAFQNFSEIREKVPRLGTFMSTMDNAGHQGMRSRDAVLEGTRVVRKYHGDFSDLTPVERTLRTGLPFYGYTKKELPMLIEKLATDPHKITNIGRLGKAASQTMGVQSDPSNPYPGVDQVIPSWLSQHQQVGIGHNRVFTPTLPTDHLNWLDPNSAVKGIAGMMTPLLKAPLELATGKTFPEGIPLGKKGSQAKGKWGSATPGTSNAENVLRYSASYLPFGTFARGSKTSTADRLLSTFSGGSAHDVRGKKTGNSKWGGP